MEIVWFVALVVFLIIEAACPIHLVSVWFAAGALAALVTQVLGGALWLQILLFSLVSCGLLACLWPVTRKLLNLKLTKTNIDALIGTLGIVTEAIDNVESHGQVKLGAMFWSARSTDGTPIPAGTHVRVDSIEGVKVLVTPTEVFSEI